jgi:hypothetical protein
MPLPVSAYANLTLVHSNKPSTGAAARKAAAREGNAAEARLKRKVEQANRVLDALEARQERIALEIKHLQRVKAAAAARYEKIEDAVIEYMEDAQVTVLAGIRTKMRTQPTPEALDVYNLKLVPVEYLRQPKTPPKEPDKVALKKAINEAVEFDPATWGCKLTSRTTLVRS